MLRSQAMRSMIARRCVRVLSMASMALLALTPSTSAKGLTGDFAVFKQCPRFTAPVDFCLHTKTTGGEVTIGNFKLPLVNAMTIQGGYYRDDESGEEDFFGALNGETMSKTPEPVPGGLLGLVSAQLLPSSLKPVLQSVVGRGDTEVDVTTELAEPAGTIGLSTDNLINEEGVALSLPVKIHLQNLFLGSECYVGSSRNPVMLNLTDGTTRPPLPNKPISGTLGELKTESEVRHAGEIEFTQITHNVDLDNSFSAPVASGCGGSYSSLIDAVLDTKLGLPSASGHNTIAEIVTVEFSTAAKVIASEE